MGSIAANETPRVSLGAFPTPLEPLPRLSAHLRGPRLWVKRDDCTGLAGGGNKVRKLEYLLAEARRQDANVILTCGAVQSNHARLTAAACARLGLRCELWLTQRVPVRTPSYERSGNMLLDRLFEAQVTLLPGQVDAEIAVRRRAEELRSSGVSPYLIPTGGSNPVGTRGYADCAAELLAQAAGRDLSIETIVTAVGSGGTLAGLAAGLAAASWAGRLVGVAVGSPAADSRPVVAALAHQTAAHIGTPGCVLDFGIDDRWLGEGYGLPARQTIEAIRLAARLEGLLLDPVYTGKAMAALIDLIRSGELAGTGDVVFLHTGGWPALFAYEDAL